MGCEGRAQPVSQAARGSRGRAGNRDAFHSPRTILSTAQISAAGPCSLQLEPRLRPRTLLKQGGSSRPSASALRPLGSGRTWTSRGRCPRSSGGARRPSAWPWPWPWPWRSPSPRPPDAQETRPSTRPVSPRGGPRSLLSSQGGLHRGPRTSDSAARQLLHAGAPRRERGLPSRSCPRRLPEFRPDTHRGLLPLPFRCLPPSCEFMGSHSPSEPGNPARARPPAHRLPRGREGGG